MNVKIFAGAEQIFAQQAQFFGLLNSGTHALYRQRVFHTHIDIPFVGADGARGNHHAFNHGVGVAFHDAAVHKCARVAFVGVADDVFFGSFFNARQIPLFAGGKAAAAAPAQAGLHNFFAYFFIGHLRIGALGLGITAVGDVFVDILGVDAAAVMQQNAFLLGIKRDFGRGFAVLVGVRVHIQQTFHRLAFHNRFFHDFGHVFGFDVRIKNIIDTDQRTGGAEAAAAADADVIFMAAFGNVEAIADFALFQFFLESVIHFHTAAGYTARAAANGNAAGHFFICVVIFFGNLFNGFRHFWPPRRQYRQSVLRPARG